jgi:hypothetical protein
MKKKEDSGFPSMALVFGYIAVKELQKFDDRVALLSRLGYGNEEIAIICNSTKNRVAVVKTSLKNKKKKGKSIK